MEDLVQLFREEVRRKELFQPGDCLLLAVSGGMDSAALCALCAEAGFPFAILHVNFQLRGEESERDESFVRQLAQGYGVECRVQRFDTLEFARNEKLSVQEAARILRYDWFEEMRRLPWHFQAGRWQSNGDQGSPPAPDRRVLLLTAHQADDNIETLLLNFFKGTGITGLHGILPRQDTLVRPLLGFRRSQLAAWMQAKGLPWVEDSSNLSDKYNRNFLRHQLIPLLSTRFPRVEENLLDNIGRFRETEILYRQAIDRHLRKLITRRGAEIHVPLEKLKQSRPLGSILFEIIRPCGFRPAQLAQAMALLDAPTGKYMLSETHRLLRHRNWLIISPLEATAAAHFPIGEEDERVGFGSAWLQVRRVPVAGYQITDNPAVAALDAGLVQFPLVLRKWKQGDYFYPLGMKKKKKLARFFIDRKMSATDKEKVWVLEMNKKIVWVLGQRIDERFRLTGRTREVLEITIRQEGV